MAKAKASVSVRVPECGAEDRSLALELGGATHVVLSVPAFACRPGKCVHLNLEARRGENWYGVPGSGRRAGKGDAISESIALPAGTEAVRVAVFAEVEASTARIDAEVGLSVV